MNLATAFAATAEKHQQKAALFWGDREYSYADLRGLSISNSRKLRDLGVQNGDRIALWLKNCPEFIAALFGIWEVGAVVVPINNFLKPDEVAYILRDAEIDLLITDQELAIHFETLHASRPKLKMLAIDQERHLATPPKTGNHSPLGSCCRLLVGGSIVLVKSLHPVRNALQEIIQREATILPAIPPFYRSLVAAPADIRLPVRLCISGAAPLPAQILKDFEAKFKIPLIEGYGLSEASPVVTKNPLDGTRKPGSIGLPIANVEVSIQDDGGGQLGTNQVGELCVRGGNVMQGYWNQPEETAKALRNGWLLTGDIGYRDVEGYYFITDRKKDMLLVNGINVYPREIEEILYQFPGVKEAAVVGKPDPRKGEQPVAFVSPTDGVILDEKLLQQFVRAKLADYKVPRKVVLLPALPRNATGKVLKTALRELAAGG